MANALGPCFESETEPIQKITHKNFFLRLKKNLWMDFQISSKNCLINEKANSN